MVNEDVTGRRLVPAYSLDEVRRYAIDEKVRYAGDRVCDDTDELGLSVEEVCACLGSLVEGDFHESIQYGSRLTWHDVYLKPYRTPKGRHVELYIKFKVLGDRLNLFICSFHPQGRKKDER